MIRRGIGTITSIYCNGGVAIVFVRCRRRQRALHGERNLTLEALADAFKVPPPPAPPIDLRGRRVWYRRDGELLLSLDSAQEAL